MLVQCEALRVWNYLSQKPRRGTQHGVDLGDVSSSDLGHVTTVVGRRWAPLYEYGQRFGSVHRISGDSELQFITCSRPVAEDIVASAAGRADTLTKRRRANILWNHGRLAVERPDVSYHESHG